MNTVLTALFAALISAGAYIVVPVGPVPIVLQNFFVILTALLLTPVHALSAVFLYLLLGALGLPVFAGGAGGFAHFFGPTGGYLLAYLPAVLLGSAVARTAAQRQSGRTRLLVRAAAALLAAGTVYLAGVPWLKAVTGMNWNASLAAGLYPFIPGDLVKAAAAALLAGPLGERLEELRDGR